MVVGSLLPVGLMQTWASVKVGYWYARSAEFLSTPIVQDIKWARVFGDTIFALGAVAIVVFVFGLALGYSFKGKGTDHRGRLPPQAEADPTDDILSGSRKDRSSISNEKEVALLARLRRSVIGWNNVVIRPEHVFRIPGLLHFSESPERIPNAALVRSGPSSSSES